MNKSNWTQSSCGLSRDKRLEKGFLAYRGKSGKVLTSQPFERMAYPTGLAGCFGVNKGNDTGIANLQN